MPDPAFLEVKTVARFFSVSPNTVYSWIRQGKIDFITLPGGTRRVPLSEVARLAGMTGEKVLEWMRKN